MKNLLYLLGVAVLGYVVYKTICPDESMDIISDPPVDADLMLQPQQRSPEVFPMDLRMDNYDQPWYTGIRNFLGEAEGPDFGSSKVSTPETLMSYNTDEWTVLDSRYSDTVH